MDNALLALFARAFTHYPRFVHVIAWTYTEKMDDNETTLCIGKDLAGASALQHYRCSKLTRRI